MLKYFDNTFFKFLFGFLVILAVSFVLLFLTERWGNNNEADSTYVAIPVNSTQ